MNFFLKGLNMKKTLIFTAVAALALAGCSKKTPEVDLGNEGMGGIAAQVQSQLQNVYFDFDKYNIRSDMRSVVASNAAVLNQAGAENLAVAVEGNCDAWGSDEYNYALGLRRANSVANALTADGVAAGRLNPVSYGESNPVCTSGGKACDAQNRRVELKVQ